MLFWSAGERVLQERMGLDWYPSLSTLLNSKPFNSENAELNNRSSILLLSLIYTLLTTLSLLHFFLSSSSLSLSTVSIHQLDNIIMEGYRKACTTLSQPCKILLAVKTYSN